MTFFNVNGHNNISVFVGNANGPVIVSTYESSLRQAGSNQDANNGPFSQQPSYSSTGKLFMCVCVYSLYKK